MQDKTRRHEQPDPQGDLDEEERPRHVAKKLEKQQSEHCDGHISSHISYPWEISGCCTSGLGLSFSFKPSASNPPLMMLLTPDCNSSAVLADRYGGGVACPLP